MKNIGILGSTGSIGVQALDVIRNNKEKFNVRVLATNQNIDLLVKQAEEFKPELLVVGKEELFDKLEHNTSHLNLRVEKGEEGLELASSFTNLDLLLISLVGFSGVLPTLNAVKNKIDVALANKEALVVAGSLLKKASELSGSKIIPVDSEHSAIFQSLLGENINKVKRLFLTASGGPFFGKNKSQLENVAPGDALKHPNWDMGSKITIDSATMMNKGLEVIEAYWLFDLPYDQIKVLIHPQSIVHSMVEFVDGTYKAELGTADMRRPIQFALTYPDRTNKAFSSLDLVDKKLEFHDPDLKNFPCLSLAYEAGTSGGSMPCVMNAVNEVAVEYFLKNKIKFLHIPEIIQKIMNKHELIETPSIEELYEIDEWSREKAMLEIKNLPVR
ncbi:1-deoxy-D-xylulose-5-phosphate reductoisomerase [Natranaerofaba carboxydovora]|uniref:1-deoxy-D-xylulose-5-phosphate reductoisomerase n=1 Tax=Natranaerofaba carboxydovora TaxID=2742683 RepID=UPI001F130905|nr:1-deoxy-D-xylulose-5-phosphate reductoisomerase [Natranaerofaba carboxydovora]UMZ73401.1 1-deoxy-D-xylulose 5-phosphate reductoisomerase [Natranaerofaba carboxydovora]